MKFSAINDDDARHKAFSGLYDGMGGGFPSGLRALICTDDEAGQYEIRTDDIDPDETLPEEGDLTEACRDRFPLAPGERLVAIA